MNDQLVRDRLNDSTADRRLPDRDRDLVAALQRRDPMAAECLVSRHGDRAYRLAAGITGSRPDAEEAVQDASWTIVRKTDTFRGESAATTLQRLAGLECSECRRCSRRDDARICRWCRALDRLIGTKP